MTTNMTTGNMNTMTNSTTGKPKLTEDNLKVLKDQMNYESLMNKKASQYAQYCNDPSLQNVCNSAANIHKQNFTALKSYLESHQ